MIERYITFSPLKNETFIYQLANYKGALKGTVFELLGKKYIEIKGE